MSSPDPKTDKKEVLRSVGKILAEQGRAVKPPTGNNKVSALGLVPDAQQAIALAPSLLAIGGLIIDAPGKYVLTDDIDFTGIDDFAIAILASDVVLDLNGHTVKYAGTALSGGILISVVSNVTVRNGTVRDFPTMGIISIVASQIVQDGLHLINNGPPASDPVLPGGSVLSGGTLFVSCSEVVVTHTNIYQNAGFGIAMSDTHNLTADGLHIDNNRELLFSGGLSLYPFASLFSDAPFNQANSDIIFRKSTVIGNSASNTIYGVAIFSLLDSYPPLGFQPPQVNVLVEDVEVFDNQGTSLDQASIHFAIGAILLTQNLTVRRLTVKQIGNNLPVGNIGVAIEVQGVQIGATSVFAEDIHVSDVFGNSTLENMTGINTELTARNIVVRNCTVQRVINNATNQRTAGFNFNEFVGFPGIIESTILAGDIQGCTAQNVRTPNAPAEFGGAGFILNAFVDSILKDNVSQNNDIGYLFQDISPGLFSSNNLVENNRAIGNSLFGFIDRTQANNAYIKNIARGTADSRAARLSNFVGLPEGTPILLWGIPGPFPCACNGYENLSIVAGPLPIPVPPCIPPAVHCGGHKHHRKSHHRSHAC